MKFQELTAGLERPKQPGKWTSLADWLTDGHRIVGRAVGDKDGGAWKLLAFGLEYRERVGAEGLDLVLPPAAVPGTVRRAALLKIPVRVFELHDEAVSEVTAPSMTAAIEWFGSLGPVRTRSEHDTASWPAWLKDLADYVETRTVVRERSGTHSWQFRGRQVLSIASGKSGWQLIAGKASKIPAGNQPTVVTVPAGAEPAPDQIHALRAAIDDAIENRRTGLDADHAESLLQAGLAVAPELVGATELKREFPVWRPQGTGSMDFLAVNDGGNLEVIETKIGPDEQLGVQGLDYWAWVTAHQVELLEQFQTATPAEPEPPMLRFVLGCSEETLLHAAARATIGALHDAIPWRVHVLTDWDTLTRPGQLLHPRNIQRLNERVLPDDSMCKS